METGCAKARPVARARYDFRFAEEERSRRSGSLLNASPIYDAGGGVTGAVGDVHRHRRAQGQEAAVARQAHLLDNVHDAILALDASYRVTYWNEAAEELFGWTREEATGRPSRDLLRATIPGATWDEALQALLDAGSFRGEVLYRHKDGHEIWADVHSRLIRDEAARSRA